jgi:hypothetical protein
MSRSSATSRLAKQVEQLRQLVEAHLARQCLRSRLRVIYAAGASEAEIETAKAAAAAEAGLDPAAVDFIIAF